MSKIQATLFAILIGCLVSPAARAEIILDFIHADTDSSDNLFNGPNGTMARAAVQMAADDINAVLNASLDPITNYNVIGNGVTGTGTTTLDLDFSLTYTNPVTAATETFDPTSLAANEIRVFVGTRSLSGATLGQGGTGGASFTGGSSSTGSGALAEAVADAALQANMIFGRGGGGPDQLELNTPIGGNPFSVTVTNSVSHLWFDNDTDNNGTADSAMELSESWHLDAAGAVVMGKDDLYSVALHEILHSIGIGTADSWDDKISAFVDGGTARDWSGPNVAALVGSGSSLIEPDASHVLAGTTSTRLSDGSVQEVVMDPNIPTGTRKQLTTLDVAFLQDIGWVNASPGTVSVPEPTSLALTGLAVLASLARRRKRASRKSAKPA